MRLEKVILENYRGFRMATTINIESDITAILGKNDAGKSSILDALNVFFNGGIEKDDACVTGDSSNVKISCVFSDLPETIIIPNSVKESPRLVHKFVLADFSAVLFRFSIFLSQKYTPLSLNGWLASSNA